MRYEDFDSTQVLGRFDSAQGCSTSRIIWVREYSRHSLSVRVIKLLDFFLLRRKPKTPALPDALKGGDVGGFFFCSDIGRTEFSWCNMINNASPPKKEEEENVRTPSAPSVSHFTDTYTSIGKGKTGERRPIGYYRIYFVNRTYYYRFQLGGDLFFCDVF